MSYWKKSISVSHAKLWIQEMLAHLKSLSIGRAPLRLKPLRPSSGRYVLTFCFFNETDQKMIPCWFCLLSTNVCWSSTIFLTFILTTKTVGANAPSSVAFHLQLELSKITRSPKFRRWKWLLYYLKPLSLLETHEASDKKWFISLFNSKLDPEYSLLSVGVVY